MWTSSQEICTQLVFSCTLFRLDIVLISPTFFRKFTSLAYVQSHFGQNKRWRIWANINHKNKLKLLNFDIILYTAKIISKLWALFYTPLEQTQTTILLFPSIFTSIPQQLLALLQMLTLTKWTTYIISSFPKKHIKWTISIVRYNHTKDSHILWINKDNENKNQWLYMYNVSKLYMHTYPGTMNLGLAVEQLYILWSIITFIPFPSCW